MAGFWKPWIARISDHAPDPSGDGPSDADPEAMDALIRDWQAAWHDLFDRDATLIAAGEFDRPDPLPAELDRDYRLIFGLSRAEKATRDACFAPLPQGADMAARFDAYLSTQPVPLAEAEARAALPRLSQLIAAAGPHEEADFTRVTIIDRDTEDGLAALRNTDDIRYVLEGSALERRTWGEPRINAARRFLSEPLYASAGNFFDLRDYVLAAMVGGPTDEIETILFRLWAGGWQVRLGGDNGIVLAKRHVGPK